MFTPRLPPPPGEAAKQHRSRDAASSVHRYRSDLVGRSSYGSDLVERSRYGSDLVGRSRYGSDLVGRSSYGSDLVGRSSCGSDESGLEFDSGVSSIMSSSSTSASSCFSSASSTCSSLSSSTCASLSSSICSSSSSSSSACCSSSSSSSSSCCSSSLSSTSPSTLLLQLPPLAAPATTAAIPLSPLKQSPTGQTKQHAKAAPISADALVEEKRKILLQSGYRKALFLSAEEVHRMVSLPIEHERRPIRIRLLGDDESSVG